MHSYSLDFPYAYGSPVSSGGFRQQAEDFQVDEELGYEPDGAGEHVYLHIRKRGENTAWVAEQIARLAKVKVSDIGYGGRKDRHAVTTQWFSVYFPKGQEPDWQLLNSDTVQLLMVARHSHKLRRGEHQRNHFIIRLRNVDNPLEVEQRLQKISEAGVPNYFGEQRFGRQGNNLAQAQSLLVEGINIRDKQKRGLILSAARSYLFNQVLARRVEQGNWRQCLSGDFAEEPSGPLWGRGRSPVSAETLAVEQEVLAQWSEWCNALEHVGLNQDRRVLGLQAENIDWKWLDTDLELSFALGGGEFATAVLREVMLLRTAEAST
jgi:tRNA pseudouridine13 synthase